MPILKIGELLGRSDELKAVTARTRKLGQLQKLYDECAPEGLGASTRVKSCRDGILFVAANNASAAAKLRHLAPRILAAIQAREPDIRELRVSVQVSGRAAGRAAPRKPPVPADALRQLEALSKQVADENLGSALARLVRHQRKPGRSR
jgi:hypothetical protein